MKGSSKAALAMVRAKAAATQPAPFVSPSSGSETQKCPEVIPNSLSSIDEGRLQVTLHPSDFECDRTNVTTTWPDGKKINPISLEDNKGTNRIPLEDKIVVDKETIGGPLGDKNVALEDNKGTHKGTNRIPLEDKIVADKETIGGPLGDKNVVLEDNKGTHKGTSPESKRGQLEDNKGTNLSSDTLKGFQRALLLLIFENCRSSGSLETKKLITTELASALKTSPAGLKTHIKRLVAKGFITRAGGCRGNGGYLMFRISQRVFADISLIVLGDNKGTIGGQLDDKHASHKGTIWGTNRRASSSSSSSSILNKEEDEEANLGNENADNNWTEIFEFQPNVRDYGITRDVLESYRLQGLHPQSVLQTLQNFCLNVEAGWRPPHHHTLFSILNSAIVKRVGIGLTRLAYDRQAIRSREFKAQLDSPTTTAEQTVRKAVLSAEADANFERDWTENYENKPDAIQALIPFQKNPDPKRAKDLLRLRHREQVGLLDDL